MSINTAFRKPAGKAPGVIVIGGYITALASVRALASENVPVVLIATAPGDIAQYSRWPLETYRLYKNDRQDPDALLQLLQRKAVEWHRYLLLSTEDPSLKLIAQNHDLLSGSYSLLTPPWKTTRLLFEKDRFHQLASQLGVDTPQDYGPAQPDIVEQVDSFPVIVKGVESTDFVRRFRVKLFLAEDRAALDEAVSRVQAAGVRARIHELVPGSDRCHFNYIVYLDKKGGVVAELGVRKFRMSPPFYGVSRVIETVTVESFREPGLRLLRHIGWTGIANVQFKQDPRTGHFRMLEINGGRCCLTEGLAWRAGVNLPYIAWSDRVLGQTRRQPEPSWPGIWSHLLDELYFGLFYRHLEGLTWRDYLRPYRRPRVFAVWSVKDPLPFCVEWGQAGLKFLRRVADRSYRTQLLSRVQPMPDVDGYGRSDGTD